MVAAAVSLVAVVGPATRATADAVPTARAGSWEPQELPGIAGSSVVPQAIAAPPTGGDAWVAGYVYNGIEFRTLALRRHGGTWTRVGSPDVETAPAIDFLDGVTAPAARDVWMVGSSATAPGNELDKPLVEHWDGTRISIVPVPDPSGGTGAALAAVSAQGRDVWAVGERRLSNFNIGGAVLHYDGAAWSVIPFHALAPGCNDNRPSSLLSVVDLGGGDIYAGGWCQTGTGHQVGLIERYSGGTWTLSATVTATAEIDSLTSADDGTVWGSGSQQAIGSAGWLRGIALHGSGTSWTPFFQLVHRDEANSFAGIAVSGTTVATVGTGPSAEPPFAGFGAYTFTGSTWKAEAVVNTFDGFGRLYGVTRDSAGHLLATGFGIGSSGDDVAVVVARAG